MIESIEYNWNQLVHHTGDILVNTFSDRELASKYNAMLYALKHDRFHNDTLILGLRRAPGSKDRHHAIEGGLVAHLMEMWRAWVMMRGAIPDILMSKRLGDSGVLAKIPITDSLVWRAILHHDLNKIYRYKQLQKDKDGNPITEWKVDYTEDNEDPLGHMLPSTYKTIGILNYYSIPLPPILLNALITAEGGFSSGPRPKTETVFAKIVYLCDELSANVINRLETDRFWDSKEGGLSGDAQF